jgi:hypothetical protein
MKKGIVENACQFFLFFVCVGCMVWASQFEPLIGVCGSLGASAKFEPSVVLVVCVGTWCGHTNLNPRFTV